MSSWIKYQKDSNLVEKPFLNPPKYHGGKGFFLPSDTASTVLLGGSMNKTPKYPQLLYGASPDTLWEYNKATYVNPFTTPFGSGIRHRPISYPPFHLPRVIRYWD